MAEYTSRSRVLVLEHEVLLARVGRELGQCGDLADDGTDGADLLLGAHAELELLDQVLGLDLSLAPDELDDRVTRDLAQLLGLSMRQSL